MNRRKSSPILLFVAGIALIIAGLVNDTTAIWIVGLVFIILGAIRRRKLSAKDSKENSRVDE